MIIDEAWERDLSLRGRGGSQVALPLGHDCDRDEWGKVRKLWDQAESAMNANAEIASAITIQSRMSGTNSCDKC